MEGAFNNAPTRLITKALEQKNVPPTISQCIPDYNIETFYSFEKGNHADRSYKELPQGQILSPMLLSVIVYGLLKNST